MDTARHAASKEKYIKIFEGHMGLFVEDFTRLKFRKWISDVQIHLFVMYHLDIFNHPLNQWLAAIDALFISMVGIEQNI